jgi:DNA polymerase-3 subunit delta'
MAAEEPLPDPTQLDGAPHPRETHTLYGHSAEQAEFLQSYNSGRLHHGWLLTGPQGLGKATLAWRLALFLLATPDEDGGMFAAPAPTTLDIASDHPVARRILAGSEGRLFHLKRGPNDKATALSQIISVEEVRKMKSFFAMSAADGGRRVAIIDSVDEMNTASSNALLKLLEEPPEKVTFFLISHQPHRLLPTIRSRCRTLRLSALPPDDLAAALAQAGAETAPDQATALAELAGGSVGAAFRLTAQEGLEHYARLVDLFSALPRLHRGAMIRLADQMVGKANADLFDLTLTLIDLFLARVARAGATGQTPPEAARGEAAVLARLAPDAWAAQQWAELAQNLGNRARQGKAVNLDPAALLMDMVLAIEATAGRLAQR